MRPIIARVMLIAALTLPSVCLAQGLWCAWFPFFCNDMPKDNSIAEVTNFGSNPGNLRMFVYAPKELPEARPLVVALHGCNQQGADYGKNAGWIKFADKYRFAVLLPQQQAINNLSQCFRWFEPEQIARNQGEALSIKQMIDRVIVDRKINVQRVFVTGLSGGGAMSAVMLATYPDVFAGGSIVAGVPYKCAMNSTEALSQCGVSVNFGQMAPIKDMTPVQWGELVRRASNFSGKFPRISIWQGTADITVNPRDEQELMEQWTNVLGIAQAPTRNETLNANKPNPVRHQAYSDSTGKVLLETFLVRDMGHGTPIDPGEAANQCGTPAPFILAKGICSSYWISKFWGIDQP